MTYKWRRVLVSDVCELIVDCVNKTAPSVNYKTPYKMIRTPNIKDGRIDLSDCRCVEEDTFNKWTRRAKVENDDVLLTREAPMGEVGIVNTEENVFLGQRIMQYRPNKKVLNPRFLLYSFLSVDLQNQFRAHDGSGSVVSHIRVPDCLKFEINVPPLEGQNRIVNILGGIDDKIELNRQINQTLEEMAQAIFKSWFVDFDPVKAKIEAKVDGQNPERAAMCAISGKTDAELDQLPPDQLAQLRTTAALFPDELIESELGLIPEGWKAGCIGDVAVAKGGYAYKSKIFMEVGYPVVKIKNIVGDGTVNLDECQCIDDDQAHTTNRFKLSDGDLLMAMTGATVGKVGLVVLSGKTAYLNQRVAKFESNQFGHGISWFLFCAFLRQSIFEQVVGSAQGSAQPNISSLGIESTRLVIPSTVCLREFIDKVEPLFLKWISNQNEIKNLASIRDTLLPKLLSGEISVDGVKSTIQEAV